MGMSFGQWIMLAGLWVFIIVGIIDLWAVEREYDRLMKEKKEQELNKGE